MRSVNVFSAIAACLFLNILEELSKVMIISGKGLF